MSEWKTYRLGDICQVLNGRAYKQEELLNQGPYPVLRVGNIFQGNNWYYSDLELPDDKYCYNGDLLYAWSCGFAPYIWKGKKSIYHYHIWKLKENPQIIDKLFFYYYLIIHTKYNLGGTHGSVMLHLTKKDFENQTLHLPPLDEQRRIAGILGSLDDKIELNRRINANLEAQAQALFRSWFVDNETQNNNPGFFNDIIQTTLSGDWGQETPKGNYISEVYCIRGADIPDIKCGDKGKLPTRYILEKNLKNKKLSENDLVVEISGGSPTQSTGRICLITRALLDRLGKDVICTNFCRALKPIPDYSFFIYLYWQYLYNNNTMFSYENGTTGIKNLNITDFINKEPIIIPEKKKILEFNKVLQPFFDMIYKNGRESEYLSALRDTLLPKLMTGEIAIE